MFVQEKPEVVADVLVTYILQDLVYDKERFRYILQYLGEKYRKEKLLRLLAQGLGVDVPLADLGISLADLAAPDLPV
jgi:hypothetical protein